jgi:RNA polymerase sigma factor (sigma-70 family)
MDTDKLASILKQVAAGEERAFAQLLRIYGDTIFSQTLAFVKSVPQTEELTQDIFMKVWRNRAKLLEVDNFENWLFILARNMIYDSFKIKLSSPLEFTDGGGTEMLTPDLQTEQRATYQLLFRGIELLPEKRQQVFRMSRLEGMTHQQIADTLGIHKVTVAQYIVMSISFLKSYLQKHTGDTILMMILLRGLS